MWMAHCKDRGKGTYCSYGVAFPYNQKRCEMFASRSPPVHVFELYAREPEVLAKQPLQVGNGPVPTAPRAGCRFKTPV
jgi:hypothetical protein